MNDVLGWRLGCSVSEISTSKAYGIIQTSVICLIANDKLTHNSFKPTVPLVGGSAQATSDNMKDQMT